MGQILLLKILVRVSLVGVVLRLQRYGINFDTSKSFIEKVLGWAKLCGLECLFGESKATKSVKESPNTLFVPEALGRNVSALCLVEA